MNKLYLTLIMIVFTIGLTNAVTESHGQTITLTGADTISRGFNIIPNQTITLTSVNLSVLLNNSAQYVYVIRASDNVTLGSQYVGSGSVANFTGITLDANKVYIIYSAGTKRAYKSGSGYTPITSGYIRWATGYSADVGNPTEIHNIESLTFSLNGTASIQTSLSSPSTGATLNLNGYNFTANYVMTNVNLVNATYYVYNSSGLFNKTKVNVVGNTTNSTILFIDAFGIGNYVWNVQACGTNSTGVTCAFDTVNRTFTVGLSLNGVIYNSTTYQSTNEQFLLNISYDDVIYPDSTVTLVYNGTAYLVTDKITSGSNFLFNKTIAVHSTVGSYQFYYNITIGGFTYQTINYTQTVSSATSIKVAAVCPTGYSPSYNFTFYDEESLLTMNNTISYNLVYGYGNTSAFSTYGNISNVSTFSICINATQPSYYLSYGQIAFTQNNYASRNFYLFAGTKFTNTTTTNNLYNIKSSSSTVFQETVTDNQLTVYQGAYTSLLRWYPNLNEYRVVDMSKTDSKGQSTFNVNTQNTDYRIAVYSQDGSLYQLFTPVRFICSVLPCTYNVFITANAPDYSSYYGVETSLTYNKTNHIVSFLWNDPSQTTHNMNLTVTRTSSNPSIVVCSKQTDGYTGIMTCDLTGLTGSYRIDAFRSASPSQFFNSLFINTKTGLNSLPNGGSFGLFFTFLLAALGALIGTFSPIAALAIGIIALIPAFMLGVINYMVLVGFFIIGGIVLHFLRKA